jgi:hypothetical protein
MFPNNLIMFGLNIPILDSIPNDARFARPKGLVRPPRPPPVVEKAI